MLTEGQHRTLQIIKDYVIANGFAPTISEILDLMRVKSRSLVQRNLLCLANDGSIRLIPNRRRNIELVEEVQLCLPLIGRIAAGQPIEAIANPEMINIPALLLGADRYLLEVKGDSMIGDNICSGDLVMCKHSDTAHAGEIAVVLVDDESATLKRVQHNKKNGIITLIPSNPALEPQDYEAHRIKIQGIYIGLLRLEK